ncbi:hypothetical protein ABIC94_003740 [Variovorax paradoxus]|uniref:hypothetical protein n=2 Tax=Comamonadaceae TaxID=80864 RepID=UPI00339AF4FC
MNSRFGPFRDGNATGYSRPEAAIGIARLKNMNPTAPLALSALPDPTDRQAVFAFAMTFNGYEHFGSSEAAFAAARERRRSSLVDVRNELFLAARASRHGDNDDYLERYRELLPVFQRLLAA